MKRLLATIALLASACGPDYMPEASEAPDASAPTMSEGMHRFPYPGDGVQAIQQGLYTCTGPCARASIFLHLDYDIDWDSILSVGMMGTTFSRIVTSANAAICPNIWVLMCRDLNCNNVYYQAGGTTGVPSLIPSARQIQGLQHFPGSLETRFCEYKVGNGTTTGIQVDPTYYPTNNGVHVWVGFQCPGNAFGGTGSTVMAEGHLNNIVGNQYYTVNMQGRGPYGDKAGWIQRFQGCTSGPYLNDSAWQTPGFPLSARWCMASPPSFNTCIPGSNITINANWY